MYALCDCNNFFASCERVFNPSLNGRPVVVLSNNDGCIIARSDEAKKLGIKMGQPLYQARPIIDKHRIAIFSSNYRLYGDMSHRVMSVLKSKVPATEVYSIDEAFLNLTGIPANQLDQYGHDLSAWVKKCTGLPVSIGISHTKTLAKVASKLCKQYPKLKGCCVMSRPEDIEKVLRKFPVEDVWGIGRRFSRMLFLNGISTAYEFIRLPPEWVKARMGVTGLRTWHELQGKECINFEQAITVESEKIADFGIAKGVRQHQICTSRSFTKGLTEFDELRSCISIFTANCAEKLRKQNSVCQQLMVFILTNRNRPELPQRYESLVLPLPVATDSTLELTTASVRMLQTIFKKGYAYKKAGVILLQISSKNAVQSQLFDTVDRPKHSRLMQTMDKINTQFGKGSLTLATQAGETVPFSRNHSSPEYTTRWNEILEIHV